MTRMYSIKSNISFNILFLHIFRPDFEYIGPLRFKPYQEEIEQSDIESFICLPGYPCCLVIFLSSGMIYHTVLITNTKELNFELTTSVFRI